MQSENVKEYELVREEMITVKDCITKYIGFVLGGSGAGVYGIVTMGKNTGNHPSMSNFEMVVVCFAISIIIHFVLLVIFYKFHSHNRFAGYCKLLNHERYEPPQSMKGTSFFAWEVLVDRLRRPELLDKIQGIKISNMDISKLNKLKEVLKRWNETSSENFVNGFRILMSAILWKGEFKSWAFPPLVVGMFSILSFGFFVTGNIFSIKLILGNPSSLILLFGIIILIVLFSAQAGMWYRYIGKLYALMEGNTTIEAFFWKFIPIRASFLNEHEIIPEYLAAEIDEIEPGLG